MGASVCVTKEHVVMGERVSIEWPASKMIEYHVRALGPQGTGVEGMPQSVSAGGKKRKGKEVS